MRGVNTPDIKYDKAKISQSKNINKYAELYNGDFLNGIKKHNILIFNNHFLIEELLPLFYTIVWIYNCGFWEKLFLKAYESYNWKRNLIMIFFVQITNQIIFGFSWYFVFFIFSTIEDSRASHKLSFHGWMVYKVRLIWTLRRFYYQIYFYRDHFRVFYSSRNSCDYLCATF